MSLSLLLEIARNHGLKEIRGEIQELQADDQVYIGFLGDFSSGKSTLINALVNQSDLLPVSVEPCTGSAAYIRADPTVTAPTFFVVDDSGATRPTDHRPRNRIRVNSRATHVCETEDVSFGRVPTRERGGGAECRRG